MDVTCRGLWRAPGNPSCYHPARYNSGMPLRWLTSLALLCALLPAQKAPFTAEALLKIKRIADPQISPDGQWVAFSVAGIEVEKNTRPRQVWIVPLAGGTPRQITTEGNNDTPRWSPDSRRIAYVSTRG